MFEVSIIESMQGRKVLNHIIITKRKELLEKTRNTVQYSG